MREYTDGTCTRSTCMCGALFAIDRRKCTYFAEFVDLAKRQYVEVRFHSRDIRTYEYHNDGPPVAVGDQVHVTGRGGATKAVEVVGVSFTKPAFKTKPILLELPNPTEEPDDAR